ncbi:ornithine cyclodeaminase family protein [Dickeya dadantii]|uniref:ornithine cyclodeaminase family protein n=1 Tax=Dickeya dadantii TaxID=204038 RepID=UPI0013735251|nr:ornithine cyclodeaminase family protein [Dickeya dadantii]NAT78107.1 Cro/Cl family transcriptional regulator [Dickeya dadantii]NPE52058.1 ornithine cyclodeaminase family protein [Dickeya dadantii]NPE62313.1 ornithine cyclodeaminase family protein [Dickeya dadantii]
MQFFDRPAVEHSLPLLLCLQLSRIAFELQSHRHVEQPLRSIVSSTDGRLMGTMPACIRSGEYAGFGLKSVLVNFDKAAGSRSHEGCILLYDAPTAGEMAIVDAGAVTELRTAAASAWATHLLAPADAKRLAILGTGVQARRHLQAMLAVRPIEEVIIWGRGAENTARFASWCREHITQPVGIADSPARAVEGADIICTVTASREPFLTSRDLPEYCHINAVGASALGFQELAAEIYADVELYLDSREAVSAASQCLIEARQQRIIDSGVIGTEIGELGDDFRRHDGMGRTLFKSVGLAVQDLVFAREVVQRHKEKRVG